MNVPQPAPNAVVEIGKVKVGNSLPLTLIAGPCQLESRDHALMVASALAKIAERLHI
jgi:2-dehydro-3-deoxyphosphooctonate aldolase (KDO 8-P synthase)